jgi:alpha-beta hydrolase superfamily lysophospholipase
MAAARLTRLATGRTVADVADAVQGLAGDSDPARPTVVCGHSSGGALAALLAADLAANTALPPQAWRGMAENAQHAQTRPNIAS